MQQALLKKIRYLLVLPFLFATVLGAFAQSVTITGKVTDEKGEGLPGVTVLLKGTTTASATDVEGNYTLSVPSAAGTLVFSYIGFMPQEVAINGRTTVNVSLASDAKLIDEVVVVGYQTVTRKELTSSVSSVNAKQLQDIPVSTAGDALAGRLAGVQVTSSEGQPGAEISIRVRGGTSITGDNSPLYIVDGIQVENALNFLSPQEIQSIDVLKDAASTSIYGARGANGVVVITTKGGKEMPTQITYNAFAGVRSIVNKLDVLNPHEFALYQYEVHDLRGADARNTFRDRYGRWEDLDIYRNMPARDWQEELFGRNAKSQTHILGVTGGSKSTSFNFNLNHADEEGIMLNSGFTRTLASFKFDHKVSDRLRTGLTTRLSRQVIEGVGSSEGQAGNNRLRNAVRYAPFVVPGVNDQIEDLDPEELRRNNLVNPLDLVSQEIRFDNRNDIILNGWFSYDLIKNLSFKTVAGIAYTDRENKRYNGPLTSIARNNDLNNQDPSIPLENRTAFVQFAGSRSHTITNSNTLQYKTKIAEEHSLNVLVGQEIWQRRTETTSSTIGWIPADLPVEQAFVGLRQATPPGLIPQDFRPNAGEFEERLFSLFANANYSFRDRYRASFSLRRDASSLFAPENRVGIFPSVALAWHIGDEPFMEGTKSWLYDLKLRASYGAVGNNRIDPDQWRTLLGPSNGYSYADGSITPGFEAGVLANRFLTWETTISRNLGLDIALFNNRVNVTIDAYRNSTNDLLLQADIPQSAGYTRQQQNVGKTRNQGVELQLDGVIVDKQAFTWSANFNIAFNRNTIVSLGNNSFGAPNPDYNVGSGWLGNANTFPDFRVAVGESVGQFYGYVTHPDKFYRVEDFETNADGSFLMNGSNFVLKPGVPNSQSAVLGGNYPRPGDLKLMKTTEGESMLITEADRTIIGSALPKFIGGFNQQLTFKNFDFSVFMVFSYGNQVYNANKVEFSGMYTQNNANVLGFMRDRWKWYDDNGQRVTDPQTLAAMNENTQYWTPTRGNYFLHSFAIEDGSFLRISNVTLGYSIPESLVARTRVFSKLRIYATVNNLYTFTKYSGYDPEANTRRTGQYGPLTPSVDYAAYPRSRFVLGGVNVTF
ncbi:SusC/RagA family TonB-linked outer membrane protein [Rufibacter roseus]|uniref:SusC/RagA family TonB-linked outer membrane protein n=1 Tax=Rufibacter roseus TaxID=1567108 RepID=A0ABW2DQQ2_9BACT|nr:TonB-dependent receptor [Rufibacter roseus]